MKYYLPSLASALFQQGEQIHLLTDHFHGQQNAEKIIDDALPFTVERFGGTRMLRRRRKAWQVGKYLRQKNIKAIITDSWKSVEYLPRKNKIPVICLSYGMEYPLHPSIWRKYRIHRSLDKVNTIVALSNYTISRLRGCYPQCRNIQIIPPGIHLPDSGEANQNALRLLHSRFAEYSPHILSLGRLLPHKGYFSILQALPRLLQSMPKLLYHIAGYGPAEEKLKTAAHSLGIAEHVIFHGTVSKWKKEALMSFADVFALPGYTKGNNVEGFGIVFIEAAAQGLPAIGGRVGGASDAIQEGKTGLLCNGENTQEVEESLYTLLSNKDLRMRFAAASRRHAEQFYWENVIIQYKKLLEDITNTPL